MCCSCRGWSIAHILSRLIHQILSQSDLILNLQSVHLVLNLSRFLINLLQKDIKQCSKLANNLQQVIFISQNLSNCLPFTLKNGQIAAICHPKS
jgi:hypothetical protein